MKAGESKTNPRGYRIARIGTEIDWAIGRIEKELVRLRKLGQMLRDPSTTFLSPDPRDTQCFVCGADRPNDGAGCTNGECELYMHRDSTVKHGVQLNRFYSFRIPKRKPKS